MHVHNKKHCMSSMDSYGRKKLYGVCTPAWLHTRSKVTQVFLKALCVLSIGQVSLLKLKAPPTMSAYPCRETRLTFYPFSFQQLMLISPHNAPQKVSDHVQNTVKHWVKNTQQQTTEWRADIIHTDTSTESLTHTGGDDQ